MQKTPFMLELAGITDEFTNFDNPRGARKLWDRFESQFATSFTLTDTESIHYRNFPDGLSKILYTKINPTSWEISVQEPTESLSTAYFLKGDIYNQTHGKPTDIIAAYEAGLHFEPTNVTHAIKLSELYRQLGRFDDSLRTAKLAWQYASVPADLANIFVLFASYAQIKLKDLKLASLLLILSTTFTDDDAYIDLLASINDQLAKPFDADNIDEDTFDYVSQHDFPVGYNDDVEVALAEFGPELIEADLLDAAKNLYTDLFTLTDDEEYAEILSEL